MLTTPHPLLDACLCPVQVSNTYPKHVRKRTSSATLCCAQDLIQSPDLPTMKPLPSSSSGPRFVDMEAAENLEMLQYEHMMGEKELSEGLEGTSVQEKLVDADFYNAFEDDFDEDDMALPK